MQIDKELETIDRVVQRVEAANNVNPFGGAALSGLSIVASSPSGAPVNGISGHAVGNMVELIQQFNELSANIDKLSSKQISIQLDFQTDDFPKETAERLEVISKCDKYLHALSVKDQMLWVALQDKKKVDENLEQERKLSQEYAEEVAQWAELSQNMASQINSLKEDNSNLQREVQELHAIIRNHNIFLGKKSTNERSVIR
jgi:hypothetical protein